MPADTSGYFAMCFTSVVVLRLALVRVSLQDEEAARAMDVLDVDGLKCIPWYGAYSRPRFKDAHVFFFRASLTRGIVF